MDSVHKIIQEHVNRYILIVAVRWQLEPYKATISSTTNQQSIVFIGNANTLNATHQKHYNWSLVLRSTKKISDKYTLRGILCKLLINKRVQASAQNCIHNKLT